MRRLTAPPAAALLSCALVLGLGLTACGDDGAVGSEPSGSAATAAPTASPSTTATTPFVVVRHQSDGGCQVLGPNCPTYLVWSDGSVELFRTGADDDTPALTGTVPIAAVDAWLAAARDLDAEVLAGEVGPGTCESCVDGADVVVVTATAHGDETLDSTVLAFDPAHPLFAALEALMVQVRAIGQLPLVESAA